MWLKCCKVHRREYCNHIRVRKSSVCKTYSSLLPCNLSTMTGPVLEGVSSLLGLVFRISAAWLRTQGDHRLGLGPRLTAWAVGGWGRLGAFVFRSALVWVVLLIWGRGVARAFLSPPGVLTSWIGLSCGGWTLEKKEGNGTEKEMPSQNTGKKTPPHNHQNQEKK